VKDNNVVATQQLWSCSEDDAKRVTDIYVGKQVLKHRIQMWSWLLLIWSSTRVVQCQSKLLFKKKTEPLASLLESEENGYAREGGQRYGLEDKAASVTAPMMAAHKQ